MDVPNILVQPSIAEVVADILSGVVKSESVWITIDGKEEPIALSKKGESSIECKHSSSISVWFDAQNLIVSTGGKDVKILLNGMRRKVLGGAVTCGDADSQGRVVVGGTGGELLLFDLDRTSKIQMEGHLLQTFFVKFFPSEKMILSTGMDYKIKLWTDDGNNVQTLQKQAGEVSVVKMIDRGRNIVSLCEADETVVLWETGEARDLATFSIPGVKALDLLRSPSAEIDNEHEYSVSGHSIIAGTKEEVLVYDLRARRHTLSIPGNAEHLSASGNILARAGPDKISILDLRFPSKSITDLNSSATMLGVSEQKSAVQIMRHSGVMNFNYKSQQFDLLPTEPPVRFIAQKPKGLWTFGEKVAFFE